MDREQHTWKVFLAAPEGGQNREVTFTSFWSPEKDFISLDEIGRACAAEQGVIVANKKMRYIATGAELVS